MIRQIERDIFLYLGIVFVCLSATAQSIDPRTPEEWQVQQLQESGRTAYWLPTRIRELEAERNELIAQIDLLPQHAPKPLASALGYHSLSSKPDAAGSNEFHYITADLIWNHELHSIGLVPSNNPFGQQTRTYGFPKRFKIEILQGTGFMENDVWVRGPDRTEWVEVVNWLDQDFPDPGPYPVVFSINYNNVSQIRVAVPIEEESAQDFFALGEIYLFRGFAGEIADNMSTFSSTGIVFEIKNSLSIEPTWDPEYVYDGVSVLGLPLSEETADVQDLIVQYDSEADTAGPIQVTIDLGEVKRIGRIELWPTETPDKMAIPLFGFPGSVIAEISKEADFDDTLTYEIRDARSRMHNDNLLTVICDGENARYIRLTFENLFEFMDHLILGLGEISVLEFGKVFSVGCQVSSKGIPPENVNQLPLLVDGYSRHRRILPESDWILGLAQRRPLDKRLEQVEADLASARDKWSKVLIRSAIIGGVLLVLLMVAGWGMQRRQRRQELNRLKIQITRDLHDEVGSSLGSISLASEQMESMTLDDDMKEELGELSLMAREANASLLEVVWLTDQTIVFLPDLLKKLVERAERVLRNVKVVSDISPECPKIKVNLTAKRHVISFFKEAVHNCARHAGAGQARISVTIEDELISLSIQDDGRGFDTSRSHDGWGLGSMKKRADELGGSLNLESSQGKGTIIELLIPLENLLTDPTQLYKTSN
jgi:signal transduction histidine kinase